MSSRKNKKETYINDRRVIGGIEAAEILTRRAKELGNEREYSRDTIYKHYTSGALRPAVETPAGNLYYAEDIEALPIHPHVGKKRKKRVSTDIENSPQNLLTDSAYDDII